MTKDLTVGSPMKLILRFALPTLFGMLFQQFYNLVDTMIVGKLLGAQALAAVGSTGSINFFVIGFCMGVCNGFAIPVAQRMGAGEHSKMRRYVANAAYLSVAFALVLTVATGLLCHTILTVMRTPSDIFAQANAYIFIIFMGIPATFLYNLLAGIIRSLGDSKTPVYFLALSSFLNIFLDIALILWFHAGVAGAAIATVVSQAISGLACLAYMRRAYPILRMTRQERRLDGRSCRVLCAMGIPMGLQYSVTAIGSIVLQSSVNALGSQEKGRRGRSLMQLLESAVEEEGGPGAGPAQGHLAVLLARHLILRVLLAPAVKLALELGGPLLAAQAKVGAGVQHDPQLIVLVGVRPGPVDLDALDHRHHGARQQNGVHGKPGRPDVQAVLREPLVHRHRGLVVGGLLGEGEHLGLIGLELRPDLLHRGLLLCQHHLPAAPGAEQGVVGDLLSTNAAEHGPSLPKNRFLLL